MQASQYGAGDCVMCKPGCWHQIQHEQQIHGCENNNKNVVNLAEELDKGLALSSHPALPFKKNIHQGH